MIYQGNARYPVHEAIVHTAATNANWWRGKTADQMIAEVRSWHMAPPLNWRREGYHYLIGPEGDVAKGRPETEIGAHVEGRNRGTLGICLVPVAWVDDIADFEDFYTIDQRVALTRLLRDIGSRTDLQRVSGHNQFANKLCPGFNVTLTDWLDPKNFKPGPRPVVPVTPITPPKPKPAPVETPPWWQRLIDSITAYFKKD